VDRLTSIQHYRVIIGPFYTYRQLYILPADPHNFFDICREKNRELSLNIFTKFSAGIFDSGLY